MLEKTRLETVKPETREYILKLAKIEQELYEEYIKNKSKDIICEEEELYNKENYINHPHDKAIKNILSDKQEAAILINQVLELGEKAEIKPNEIAEYKTDFVTTDYFNREIDVIYQDLKQKNVFYLIEHQSKVDYRMSMRLIEYYAEVMKNTYKNREKNKKYEMPVIIPIIVYSGEGKWNARTSINKDILSIRKIVPFDLGSYKVFDVNDYSDKELIKQPGVLTKVLSLEKAKNSIQVEKKTNMIAECNLNEKEKSYLIQYITYIIGEAYGKDTTNKLLKKINKNVKEEKSMLIDVLYQVEARGEARGRMKEREKIKAIAKELLKRGMTKEEVEKIVQLDKEENKK